MKAYARPVVFYISRSVARARGREPWAKMMLRLASGGYNPRRYYRKSAEDPTLVKGRPSPLGAFLGQVGRLTGIFPVPADVVD